MTCTFFNNHWIGDWSDKTSYGTCDIDNISFVTPNKVVLTFNDKARGFKAASTIQSLKFDVTSVGIGEAVTLVVSVPYKYQIQVNYINR